MIGRRLAAFAVGASCLVLATAATAGPPVQVTIYIPGYGQPQAAPPAQQPSAQQPPPNANLTLQAEVAIAQAAAYQRYLQYVAIVSSQGGRGGGGDPSQYFTNGAAATTVPLAGPGSAYFANGAEATRVPGPPPARVPAPLPDAPQPPPPSPPQVAAPSAPPAPLAPFWWVEGATPAALPAQAAAAAVPPPPPPSESADDRPQTAMSFEDWLQSMGADVREAVATDPSLTSAEVETAPLAGPSAAVLEVRPRVVSALREKSRERVVAPGGSSDVIVAMAGTFAAGLLLGALAMRRPRARAPE